jgi:4-hydroxy-tetrahydrodipicolinate reductase
VKYALVGYGRMGRAIEQQADNRGHRRVAVIDPAVDEQGVHAAIGQEALAGAEMAFEFSCGDAVGGNISALLRAGVSVVCGTTGFKRAAELNSEVSESGAGAVLAPNFSVGMNLFYRLVREAGRLYGAAGLHEPFIFEAHHRGKGDAPSGTARKLASILLEVDRRLERVQEGNPEGRLPDGTLHVASLRAGSEPGAHTVGFDGEFDRIVLSHSARSRDGFALGAVLAAEWLRGRRGLHTFEEVLQDLIERQPE